MHYIKAKFNGQFLLVLSAAWLLLAGAPTVAQTTLKIATVTPEGSTWMKDMKSTAAEIKEKTDGRVVIKYYGGGSRGTDTVVLRKMRLRELQGGVFTPSAVMEIYPDIGLYGLPMVFTSDAEASYVREKMDAKLLEGMEDAGLVSFGFAATGFAMMMSKEPVEDVDDLRGKRVWVPDGDEISRVTMEALGVQPHPLPLSDVYTALQTGALDIIAMSSVGANLLQYHTKLNYVTDFPLVYTMGFMAIDKKTFDRISAADQQIVRDVMSGLYERYNVTNMQDEEAAKQSLFKAGMEQVVPDAAKMAEIRAILRESNAAMAARGVVSEGFYNEMLAHVDEYRNGTQTVGTESVADE